MLPNMRVDVHPIRSDPVRLRVARDTFPRLFHAIAPAGRRLLNHQP